MNEKAKIEKEEVLSDQRHTLKKITSQQKGKDGKWQTKVHEIYELGGAVTILLYNKGKKTVILTRQFRIPAFIKGNRDGMLIEACAGKLDNEKPEDAIKREVEEETGYKLSSVQKIMEAYSTPGSVTEIIHYFVADYSTAMKVSEGGGLKKEKEEVEVLEVPFNEALEMIEDGKIKDAKTIILLQYARLHNLL